MANATLIELPVPPITGKRVAPQTVALTGRNFMAKADAIAVHWYSLIDSVLEANKYGEKGKNEPLPQWAVERLNDGGRLNSDYEEHLQQINMSKDALRLAEDGESANAFEVWDRAGRHMSYRHPTFEDAQIALDKAKASGKCKEPFIARISRRSIVCSARAGAELLPTMIGTLHHTGTYFGHADGQHRYELQDDTGRSVIVLLAEVANVPELRACASSDFEELIAFELSRANKGAAT